MIDERPIESLHEAFVEILDDEDDARAPVCIRPSVEAMRRVKDMLHAMDRDGPLRIVSERDDSLHAQHARPMRVAQKKIGRASCRERV